MRQPAVAGMFYPSDPERLASMASGFIAASGLRPDPAATGAVSPHAGYVYSGSTAGMAFAVLPEGVETVLLVAPCHRHPVRVASVFDGDAYATPLGAAPVDREVTGRLLSAGRRCEPAAHSREHAEEVLVPFVQVRWPGARIVPVVQGAADPSSSARLAEDLFEAASGRRAVLVASSDLSHYHPLARARRMDTLLMEDFASADPEAVYRHAAEGATEACGLGPILTLLSWAGLHGPFEARVVGYTTSAAASGDTGSVVGYMAAYTRRRDA